MGISLFLVMFNIHAYNNFTDIHVAWKIVGIAVSVIQFILIMFMMMFLTTQAVTYKLKIWGLIKNSFLFAIALVPQNLFFLAISIIPIVLMLVLPTMFSIFIVMIYAFIGFSYLILVWTLYAHSMFDRFINDKIEGAKNRGIYKRTPEEIERDRAEKAERDRKNRNIRFNNPKKKKKVSSIDEGSTFEPLPTTFSRADLARLQEQKEAVKREIDAEYDDIEGADEDDEAGADDDFYTGGETGTPAEGTEAPARPGRRTTPPQTAARTGSPNKVYTALAKYYDRLMNVDGDAWADYLCALIGGRDDGADLACGTGAITLRLIARGKRCSASTISPRPCWRSRQVRRRLPACARCSCRAIWRRSDPRIRSGSLPARATASTICRIPKGRLPRPTTRSRTAGCTCSTFPASTSCAR